MSWIKMEEPTWYQRLACKILQCGQIPKHVAFILDGNRRFAQKHGVGKILGHTQGFDTLSKTLDWCRQLGITEVTVYAFSIENFKRSKEEVDGLMNLAREKFKDLIKERQKVIDNGIRVRVIGNITMLPEDLQKLIAEVHLMTEDNDRAVLNIALAYTSREEMTHAVNEILWGTQQQVLLPEDIDDSLIEQCLYTWKSNHPDLMIRTSGEVRLSDFLLWQASYSCLHFTTVLWPEFSFWDLFKAVLHYQSVYPTIQEAKDVKARHSSFHNRSTTADPSRVERIENFISKVREKEERYLRSLIEAKA